VCVIDKSYGTDLLDQMDGISTYPFFIFGNGWEEARPAPGELP
jgi:hypothetical protein